MRSLNFARPQLQLVVVGGAFTAALAVALMPGRALLVSVGLILIGTGVLLVKALPAGLHMLKTYRSTVFVLLLLALIVAWVLIGLHSAESLISSQLANGQLMPSSYQVGPMQTLPWPWSIGRMPVLWSMLVMIGAAVGFVLIADAVRVRNGLGRPPRSAWHSLIAPPTRAGRVAARAIPGLILIFAAAFASIVVVSHHFAEATFPRVVWTTVVVLVAILLMVGPLAVGALLGFDFNKEEHAREAERRRVAAHLHDSVLQTLALIQRQADDPAAVSRLARRQEHALRAWMAGDVDLSKATLAGSVRDTIEEVEDEEQLKIELTVIGDVELDRRGEELIAAMREALRNVARHAPGAGVNVFLDISRTRAELFVRDSGPGFEFEDVPPERRGLRDAIIGRMGSVGGSVTIDSAPGEGAEIALRLPARGGER